MAPNSPKIVPRRPRTVFKRHFFHVKKIHQFWSVLGSILDPFWDPFGSPNPPTSFTLFFESFEKRKRGEPKAGPKRPQETSKRPPRAPRRAQEAPRGHQETTKSGQELPQSTLSRPNRPNCTHEPLMKFGRQISSRLSGHHPALKTSPRGSYLSIDLTRVGLILSQQVDKP